MSGLLRGAAVVGVLVVLVPLVAIDALVTALWGAARRHLAGVDERKRQRVLTAGAGAYVIACAESRPRPIRARPRPRTHPAVTEADRRLAAAMLARRRPTCEERRP